MEDIVRPELNLEKWPAIWQLAKAGTKLNKVVLERKNSHGYLSSITVTANSEYGVLTTEAQKVLYALYKISEEKNHPRRVFFSRNKIAKILKKSWGNKVAEIIDKGLYQLRFTAFVLKDAFYEAINKKTVNFISTFTILSVLEMSNEVNGHSTREECYCEFNDYIYSNLVSNYVKPLLLDTFLSFGDDGIAQIAYSHLDLILSKTNFYRRKTKEVFFNELHLIGKEYEKLSVRKRTIERIKTKLDGKSLSSGGILEINLEKPARGDDYDLVAIAKIPEDTPTSEINEKKYEKDMFELTTRKKIEKIIKKLPLEFEEMKKINNNQREQLENKGTIEIVQYFHKKFFNLDGVKASPKEIKQAQQLIEEYGFNTTKYIVDYTYSQAIETNYKLGQFGAILEYAGRGACQYEKDAKKKEYLETLANCQLCNGLIYIDVAINEKGKERYTTNFRCPHDIEKLKTIAADKQIKLRLRDGQIINFKND